MRYTIVQWKFPFTNHMHEPAKFACWEESITHNTEWTGHSGLGMVAMERLHQSWASVWCAARRTSHMKYALSVKEIYPRIMEFKISLYKEKKERANWATPLKIHTPELPNPEKISEKLVFHSGKWTFISTWNPTTLCTNIWLHLPQRV